MAEGQRENEGSLSIRYGYYDFKNGILRRDMRCKQKIGEV